MSDYDDGFVVLGGTRPRMAVDQGEQIIRVGGSTRYMRDPRRGYMTPAEELVAYLRAWQPVIHPHQPGKKFCSGCGDWIAVEQFSPDRRNIDGLHSWCKPCRNEAERHRYAREQETIGRMVRTYRRFSDVG